jgi:hypothetical protein
VRLVSQLHVNQLFSINKS